MYDVSLTEFETAAIDRLRVLSEIEASFVRGRSNEDLKAVVDAQCEKYSPLHRDGRSDDKELERQRKKDHIGHFVLRLAFCRSCVIITSHNTIHLKQPNVTGRNFGRVLLNWKPVSSNFDLKVMIGSPGMLL